MIYINDTDPTLYHSDFNWHRHVATLNSELLKLSDWLQSNKLSLNIKKCNYIQFGHMKAPLCDPELRLLIDGHILERIDRTQFLGIIIDSKLTWSDHVQYISLKILKSLGIMSKLRNLLPCSV